MDWISVEDKLPKKYGYYLTHDKNNNFVAKDNGTKIYRFYPKTKKFWWFGNIEPEGITHWMPLPKPPKE